MPLLCFRHIGRVMNITGDNLRSLSEIIRQEIERLSGPLLTVRFCGLINGRLSPFILL